MAGSELVQHLLEESQSYPLPNCSHINKWMFAGRGDLLPDEVLAGLEPSEEVPAPHDYAVDGRNRRGLPRSRRGHQDTYPLLLPPSKIGDLDSGRASTDRVVLTTIWLTLPLVHCGSWPLS